MNKQRQRQIRPSVHHAKEWLGQLFLIPGLEKCITYGCGHFNNDFPVNQAFFGMLTTKRTTKQPGDPSASLLLTSEKAVFCKIQFLAPSSWGPLLIGG